MPPPAFCTVVAPSYYIIYINLVMKRITSTSTLAEIEIYEPTGRWATPKCAARTGQSLLRGACHYHSYPFPAVPRMDVPQC